ncbi:PREDICTED: protein VASCULAR ASSOCIATED DEATH 1, chloroplastic [Ipomoea nil]|uniref:protein VASCULAR ASSOCIATED DEATH 1, chloroplastic n=1 Tax=Ipomoea nil TaxID=35883 RepID=UPI000901FEDF|nr:PREDICTED: protein VASCULAR ASSOCIATED DEATH 1, chloroplastic [Ipomoea nil]
MAAVLSDKAAEAASPSPPRAQFMEHYLSAINSRRSDVASDASDLAFLDRSSSLSSSARLSDSQSLLALRSEEYRQLFRLPVDEVLIQDFNCALQENFLLQGHMYLFAHNICFYSNLFGFETKKIIPFHEVTSVRRAKAAAIFPTAIEIIAGGKKFFFTSFLSRDEAFKLINDGWLQHNNGPKANGDQQEQYSEPISQEGSLLADKTESPDQPVDEAASVERDKEISVSDDTKPLDNGDYEIVPNPSVPPDSLEEAAEIVQSTDCSSSGKSLVLEEVDYDAPQVPEDYTLVAESKFPVKVEEFFDLFFSDDGADFQESFHKKCGDKDFKCTPWRPHEKFGHTRNVSFQHPIKIYFGAKFGSCQELMKYRVYRNCHLVVETSQEITDVPYGDYFQVEGLWDVKRDDSEGCILKVYTNVAFSKKTMWKGKIVQSTVDECRDAYAIWIELAHELLKQRKLEMEEAGDHAANLIPNGQVEMEKPVEAVECTEKSDGGNGEVISQTLPDSNNMNRHPVGSLQEEMCTNNAPVPFFFRDLSSRFSSLLKSQSHFYVLLIVAIAVVLLLMQMSIIVLLSRPQQIHVISQGDYMGGMNGMGERGVETLAYIDKQVNHLKEEMLMVETMLHKMQNEYELLKVRLNDFERIKKYQKR